MIDSFFFEPQRKSRYSYIDIKTASYNAIQMRRICLKLFIAPIQYHVPSRIL